MLMINDTFALVLQRIGDQNVLPHVHIMLTFLSSFASKPWVSNLLDDAPWSELAAFLNALAVRLSGFISCVPHFVILGLKSPF
jgi:hypothetical protein